MPRRNRAPLVTLVLFAATAAQPAGLENPKADSTTGNLVFRLETVTWSPPYDGPLGYPKGAQRASLGIDSVTGGETYYARFPAESRFDLHWHSHAEYAVVLRGTVTHTLGQVTQRLSAGDYVIVPPKTNHGWVTDAGGDVFLLIRRDGPADFNFVSR